MITIFADNKEIETNYMKFSDGAVTYKLDTIPENPRYIAVNVCPTTPANEVLEELRLISSCIFGLMDNNNLYFDTNVILNIPYLVYSRCDRIFEKGNPSGLESFLEAITDLALFNELHTCDIHNRVVVSNLLEERSCMVLHEKTQLQCFKESIGHNFNTDYDIIIAPDKGAVDKARTIAEHLEVDICYAGKRRDISTGKIVETLLPTGVDFEGCKVLIPDDILDGGYTFIKLAEKLKEAGAAQVDLYVTHLIAAKGLDILKPVVDNLFCYQTVGKFVNKQDVLNFNLGK